MKKILIILTICLLFIVNNKVYAQESKNTINRSQNEFVYNLDNPTSASFEYFDEAGLITITIEKISEPNRTINDGRYKISTSRNGSWNASFQVSIKNYRIVSAGNSQATAIVGSFVSKNLKIDNNTTTTYYLKRKVGVIITNIYLRAQISDKNLRIVVK